MIRKEAPFTETILEDCHEQSKWKNQYGGKLNNKGNSNDVIVFEMLLDEKELKNSVSKKVLQIQEGWTLLK